MKSNKQPSITYWLPVLLWMGIIFTFSSYSASSVSSFAPLEYVIKKTIHIIEYGILWYLTFTAFKNTTQRSSNQIIFLSFLVTILYAISDEYHQSLVPSRHPSSTDVIIDSTGAILSYLIYQNNKLPAYKKYASK